MQMTALSYKKNEARPGSYTISNKLVRSGRLGALISSGAIYGVTSNPTIFGQSIQKNEGDYNAEITRMAAEGKDAFAIYDALTQRDIAEGADLFRPLQEVNAVDGWISLEVLPSLAHDTTGTVAEAPGASQARSRGPTSSSRCRRPPRGSRPSGR
jgi:transaldolase